ncbi:hypothetical protein [Streptomyces sp. NPDC006355]|uniref:hypothetical protein n=1 Tax=Streptomyces sp. NPDC006355 TaxID=3156758 RepID=UPI0033A1C13D
MTDLPNFPWPWPDYEPPEEPVTGWVLYDDGSIGSISVTGGKLPVLGRPGRLITKEEYERLTAEMTAAHTARLEAAEAEAAARQAREYRDLTTAGVPDATARSLTGYTGTTAASSTGTA